METKLENTINILVSFSLAEIRENKDNLLQYELAAKFNVSKQLISNIVHHKRGY